MEILYILISLALVVFLFFCGRVIFIHRKREIVIKNFESYSAVLQFYMEKAYQVIHKDQVLTYSLEATTLPDKEFRKASIDFIQLVEKLLGPTLINEMIFVFGNYDTFVFNLAEYFNTRYDDDEIRKTAMNDIMEKEVEPERA